MRERHGINQPTASDEWTYPLHMSGALHSIGAPDDGDERVKALHEIVKEVTGKAVEEPPKPRIGFLP